MADLTPETLAEWREESQARIDGAAMDHEYADPNDLRIIALLDALAAEKARAEQAEAERDKWQRRADQNEEWWRKSEAALSRVLWSCPDCAFTFDAMHTGPGDGYSCPVCGEAQIEAALSRVLADVEALADEWEQESPVTSPWYVAELRALVDKHTGGDQS